MGDGGGQSTTTSYDKEYNDRMAAIAEEQQGMGQEAWNFYKSMNLPFEQAKINANMELIPQQTELQKAEIGAALGLLPSGTDAQKSAFELQTAQNKAGLGLVDKQTELAGAQLDSKLGLLPKANQAASKFLDQSIAGVNIEDRMGKATASMAHQFKDAAGSTARQMGRMGGNPSSARMVNSMNNLNMQRAKSIALGKETARTNAEDENYKRLSGATGFGLGLFS